MATPKSVPDHPAFVLPLLNATHLAGRVVHAQLMTQLLLTDRTRSIDLVTQDQKRNVRQRFDREQGVELGFGFRESLDVGRIDEEDDAVDFGEVVAPQAAC